MFCGLIQTGSIMNPCLYFCGREAGGFFYYIIQWNTRKGAGLGTRLDNGKTVEYENHVLLRGKLSFMQKCITLVTLFFISAANGY